MATMKVQVDVEACCGHARCAAVAPEVYVLNDDGYLDTPEVEVAEEQAALARRGARACPERAIAVLDADG